MNRNNSAALPGFWRDQSGQDIGEYSLLLGFVFLVSLCLCFSDAIFVQTIWSSANNLISRAASETNAATNGTK